MRNTLAFSVDLEPNKDGTFTGVADAMSWFNDQVPNGTVFSTYRIATELPDLLANLASTHEIGVHVHPREFGHEHDQFAELSKSRQREILSVSREAIADATGLQKSEIVSFRAGRHSIDKDGLDVLAEIGFDVDASININYTEYLPENLTRCAHPFKLANGLREVPTTYINPSLISLVGLCILPSRTVTATATTLRADSWLCSGECTLRYFFSQTSTPISMYMHPYDATSYHDMKNDGHTFRRRAEQLFQSTAKFVSVRELSAYDE